MYSALIVQLRRHGEQWLICMRPDLTTEIALANFAENQKEKNKPILPGHVIMFWIHSSFLQVFSEKKKKKTLNCSHFQASISVYFNRCVNTFGHMVYFSIGRVGDTPGLKMFYR